jgi:predicted permease
MTGLFQDFRYALRQLRKSPGFTVTAILLLALGIGANTSIFQLLAAVNLRNLPVEKPQELAEVKIAGGNQGLGIGQRYGELTQPLWQLIREHQQAFSGVFAWSANQRFIGRGSEMRPFNALWVSGDFFRILGIKPWRGRLLTAQDESPCPESYAVASFAYWQRELGGRDVSDGISLVANNNLVEIVGVTPPQFFGMAVGENFDLAFPFCQPKDGFRADIFDLSVMGRLKPGWTIPRASAEMEALSPGMFEATVPPARDPQSTEAYKSFRLAAYPASTGVSSLRDYDQSLVLLLGITGLVLLIACANLANLMLARTSARSPEIATRLALGASRRRLIRQLLAESILLTVVGALLGITLAQSLSRVLVSAISTADAPVSLQLVTDWRVLWFAIAAAGVTCAAFGVVPALRATGTHPLSVMKAGGRRVTSGRERFSLQRVLVVTQISVSLVLLVGALLFVRSFRNLVTFNPGMREGGLTVAFLGYWQSDLPEEQWGAFEREIADEIRSVPGVESAATTTRVPLQPGSWEHLVTVGAIKGESKFTWVSPEYFSTMDIPVVRGRGFNLSDTAASPRVAVVNQTFIRRYLGGVDPIGHTLRTSPEGDYPATVYQIVGVIPDTQYNDLRSATPPIVFAPASQIPGQGPWGMVMIRSNLATPVIAQTIKRVMSTRHPDVLVQFSDFQQQVRDGLLPERLMATLSGFFGFLAVLLTIVGLYGVISYIVLSRRNEIGIRMALGASRGVVVRSILRQTLALVGFGIAIGVVFSLIAVRGASSLLFELRADDLPTFAVAAALLATIALFASIVPAYRATKVDPIVALRYE